MSIWLFFVPLLQLFFWFKIEKKKVGETRVENKNACMLSMILSLKLHVCVYSESEREENLFISGW